jgi:hypothetical protein
VSLATCPKCSHVHNGGAFRERSNWPLTLALCSDCAAAEKDARVTVLERENAALRKALALLLADVRFVSSSEPPERMIPTQHRASDIWQALEALGRTDPPAGEEAKL